VFPLLAGLTLGTQDGGDLVVTTEAPGTNNNNHANRIVEAWGQRFLLHGDHIYERDTGGTGNWGQVATLTPMSNIAAHGGLHTLTVDGRIIVACLWRDDAGKDIYKIFSADGVNWTTTLIASYTGASGEIGSSVVFGTSIAWWCRTASGPQARIYRHDFSTGSTITYANNGSSHWGDQVNRNMLTVARNTLYAACHGSNGTFSELVGASFSNSYAVAWTLTEHAYPHGALTHTFLYFPHGAVTGGPFEDLQDIVGGTSGATARIMSSGVGAGYLQVDMVDGTFVNGETITQTTGPNTGANAAISADPEIEENACYWTTGGDNTRFSRYNKRVAAFTGGGGEPNFGPSVSYGVAGVFRSQDPNPLNQRTYVWFRAGTNYNNAVQFSLYRIESFGTAWTSLGSTTITADQYGIVLAQDGGAERIFALGAARPQFGTQATLLTHGAVTNDPFQVGETVSGGTSGESAVVVEVFTGSIKVVNQTGTFSSSEVITGGTSTAFATTSAVDEDATFPPKEVAGARRRYFRVYGTGSALSLDLYYSGPDIAGAAGAAASGSLANKRATIVAVGVVAGSPTTTPSLSTNQIINLTPDDGATLYYVDANSVADGLVPGQLHALILDPA
jgi:hypothetical protein